jgi:hypothetical protein
MAHALDHQVDIRLDIALAATFADDPHDSWHIRFSLF